MNQIDKPLDSSKQFRFLCIYHLGQMPYFCSVLVQPLECKNSFRLSSISEG